MWVDYQDGMILEGGAWVKAYYDRKLTEEEVQSYELVYGGQEND